MLLGVGVAPAQEPALNYLQYCVGCHMQDGSGSAANNVPDMRGTIGHFVQIPQGRAFLIQVAGVAQAPIPANELAALMNWLLPTLSANEMPAEFTPYSAAEVAQLRSLRPADLPAMRARLIQQLSSLGYPAGDY
jgi:mono/diheme cytochrome c family protein